MTIRDLFNKYPQLDNLLDTYNFEKIYTQLQPEEKGIFTQACLEVLSINPLEYLDYVPDSFAYSSKIKSITIPDNVMKISHAAFSWCSDLGSIEIPNSVTNIGDHAFYYCYNLSSITIPDSVTSIDNGAFVYCTSLKSLSIPDTVMSIGDWAFYCCNELKNLQFKGTKEQWKKIKKSGSIFSQPSSVQCIDGNLEYKR